MALGGGGGAKALVLKNALLLVGAQVIGTPLSILVNAAMGRYLGAAEFGHIYLASTLTQFGFLFVDWGQSSLVPAVVARDRARSGEYLGTALLWRVLAGAAVYAVLAGACLALGYGWVFQVTLVLVTLQVLFGALSAACQDTIRGFERTDVGAIGQVGQQLLNALLVVPTVVLGGRVRAALAVQIVGPLVVLGGTWRALRSVGVSRLSVKRDTLKMLVKQGAPFLLFGFAMTLQNNVDTVLLSKLAPPQVVGWHAVARRLIGTLVVPASALVTALYPTLARLYSEDKQQFKETTRAALRGTTILAVPLALSCAFYRDIGIMFFSRGSFGPAGENLIVLSGFLFLMYFSMPLGSALLAAGRQRQWAVTQFICVVVSVVLDPLLIPWFQSRYGNGGLGVCAATVVSECVMVGAGVALNPGGIFDRSFFAELGRAGVAGGAMAAVAWLLSAHSPFLGAPLALAAYLVCLWLVGGLNAEQIGVVRNALGRKFRRA